MPVERDDLSGLEFPWLLPFLVLPALPLVLRRAETALPVTGPVVEPVTTAPPSSPTAREAVQYADEAIKATVDNAVAAAVQRSTPETASTPAEKQLAQKTQQAATEVEKIVERHEAAVVQKLLPQAAKLVQAGMPQAEADRRVRAVIDKLPSSVRRKAVEEVKATGRVSEPTRAALKDVKARFPDVQKKIEQAAAPVRHAHKAVERDVRKKAEKVLAPARDVQRRAERAAKAIPAPLRPAIDKATAPLQRDAVKAGKATVAPAVQAGKAAVDQVLAPIKAEATKLGRQLGVGEATKAFRDFGKKMGIPNIPVQLPTDLSPAGIRDAAYNTGKKIAQEQFKRVTGLPLPLPPAVSIKAITKWADDLVPNDARQAIEMAIDVGLSATTSAVSAILTGAIGGSIVPGLGTVIGIGVALGVAVLKGVVKEALIESHAYQKVCEKDKDSKKYFLAPLSPLELVPWIAQKSFDVSKAVADEQHRTKCGLTPYSTGLRTRGKYAFDFTKATVPLLGVQQLDRLIQIYDHAPKQAYFWDTGRRQAGGAIVGGTGKVLLRPSAAGQDVSTILTLMKARKVQVQNLVSRASRVEKLQPNELAPLRFELVTEIGKATTLYQLDPSPSTTEAWLKQLMGYLGRLVRTEAAAVGAMKARYEQDLRKEAELKKQGKTGVVYGII
jgi:hypothetical protein